MRNSSFYILLVQASVSSSFYGGQYFDCIAGVKRRIQPAGRHDARAVHEKKTGGLAKEAFPETLSKAFAEQADERPHARSAFNFEGLFLKGMFLYASVK